MGSRMRGLNENDSNCDITVLTRELLTNVTLSEKLRLPQCIVEGNITTTANISRFLLKGSP